MDVVFVNDTSSGLNWGSQATSRALRRLLLEGGATIEATEYKRTLRGYEGRVVPIRMYLPGLLRRLATDLAAVAPADAYRTFRRAGSAIPETFAEFDGFADLVLEQDHLSEEVDAIRRADAVLLNGEGLVYSSEDQCTRAMLFLAYLATTRLDTRTVLVNHTLEVTDERLGEMVRNVYPLLDDVVFREPASADRYGHLADHRVAADAGFAFGNDLDPGYLQRAVERNDLEVRPYHTASFDPTRPYACVAGSSIFPTRGRFPVAGYRALCERLLEVVPQVVLVVSAAPDERLLAPVAESLDLPLVGLNVPTRGAIQLLANASVYVGGRYHPMIFAAKGGTPLIPLSANTHKIEGLLQLLDLDLAVQDPFDLVARSDDIAGRAIEHVRDGGTDDRIRSRVDELADLARENVSFLVG